MRTHLRALCLLPDQPRHRRDLFCNGLRAVGIHPQDIGFSPEPNDYLICWNRYRENHGQALRFEAVGARVLIAENGYLPVNGATWFAVALGHHAGAGTWSDGGPERWDALGVELRPWRTSGSEVVILGQRGIGEPGIASPKGWAESVRERHGGRIRPHPGQGGGADLELDLANARSVITWASGAALKALAWGIPVWCDFPRWIGAAACRPLSEFGSEPKLDDADRLAMFRRLAWAQWTDREVESGEAFARLLS